MAHEEGDASQVRLSRGKGGQDEEPHDGVGGRGGVHTPQPYGSASSSSLASHPGGSLLHTTTPPIPLLQVNLATNDVGETKSKDRRENNDDEMKMRETERDSRQEAFSHHRGDDGNMKKSLPRPPCFHASFSTQVKKQTVRNQN